MGFFKKLKKKYRESDWIEHKDAKFDKDVIDITKKVNGIYMGDAFESIFANPKPICDINKLNIGPNTVVTKDNVARKIYLTSSYSEKASELSSFAIFFSALTKELLEAKGFEIDRTDELTQERIALLHTEVSELIDAEKKGKSSHEKSMELADIVIRLLNIPLMYPEILENIRSFADNEDEIIRVNIGKEVNLDMIVEYSTVGKVLRYQKFRIANNIHRLISDLEQYLYLLNNSEYGTYAIDSMSENIFRIILYCNLYITVSPDIEGKLYDFVETKMKENFKRPYRYNTSENF